MLQLGVQPTELHSQLQVLDTDSQVRSWASYGRTFWPTMGLLSVLSPQASAGLLGVGSPFFVLEIEGYEVFG